MFGSSSGTGQSSTGVSKSDYAIGFVCTLGSSAGCGLLLALTQFAFRKVIKVQTMGAVVKVVIYQSLVATGCIIIGLFGSGEWKGLRKV